MDALDGCSLERMTPAVRLESAVHNRLAAWAASGILLRRWRALLDQLNEAGKIRGNACFVDGMFVSAQKGGTVWARPQRGQGTTLRVLADGQGTPLGVCVEQASPAEVTLLERTLDRRNMPQRRGRRRPACKPERLMADRGYDRHRARALLVTRAIDPMIPRRKRHTVATHQEGRKLRR